MGGIRGSAKNYGRSDFSRGRVDRKETAATNTICNRDRFVRSGNKYGSDRRWRKLDGLVAFNDIAKLGVMAIGGTSIGPAARCRQPCAAAFCTVAATYNLDRDVPGRRAENHIRKREGSDERYQRQ